LPFDLDHVDESPSLWVADYLALLESMFSEPPR
jgi:hypothetical protein